MKKYFLAFLFFIYSIFEFSQFIADFSDENSEPNIILLSNINNLEINTLSKLRLFIKRLFPNKIHITFRCIVLDGRVFGKGERGHVYKRPNSK
jgi:hypothetical protein